MISQSSSLRKSNAARQSTLSDALRPWDGPAEASKGCARDVDAFARLRTGAFFDWQRVTFLAGERIEE